MTPYEGLLIASKNMFDVIWFGTDDTKLNYSDCVDGLRDALNAVKNEKYPEEFFTYRDIKDLSGSLSPDDTGVWCVKNNVTQHEALVAMARELMVLRYKSQIIHMRDAMIDRDAMCDALKDIRDHGCRHDTAPTMSHEWSAAKWYEYLASMDRSVRTRAADVLQARGVV